MEGVAGGDPVPFLGDSQLVTFLYVIVKGHQPPPWVAVRQTSAIHSAIFLHMETNLIIS